MTYQELIKILGDTGFHSLDDLKYLSNEELVSLYQQMKKLNKTLLAFAKEFSASGNSVRLELKNRQNELALSIIEAELDRKDCLYDSLKDLARWVH